MDNVRIRACEDQDAEVLFHLIKGFRDHLKASSPTDDDLRAQLPRALGDPTIEFACAWLEDVPVGYSQTRFATSVWVRGIEAHLEDLFITSAARRRSIGRLLLRCSLRRARERGAVRVTLATNDGNGAAQALYRSEGFSPQSHALYPGGREVLWSSRILRSSVDR